MRFLKKLPPVIVILGLLATSGLLAKGPLLTIVHPDLKMEKIDKSTLEKVYSGKKRKWSDGTKVVPVTLKANNALSTFVQANFRQSPSQFSTYWKRRMFTGKGTPPRTFSTPQEVINYISNTRGAIGFIPDHTPHEGVRTVAITN